MAVNLNAGFAVGGSVSFLTAMHDTDRLPGVTLDIWRPKMALQSREATSRS